MEGKKTEKEAEKKTEKNAVVFIDGNNFYHNINLMIRINRMGIKAGHIDFYKLSENVCSWFGFAHKKTRYYNSIPSVEDGKEMYWKHINYLEGLEKLPKFEVITRKLQRSSTKEILNERKEIITNLGLCKDCKPLVETSCYDCIGNIKKREKGIDVKIAVDMVEHAIKDKCDCIILISGDGDFIPALKIIEENKKVVSSAALTFGYSYDLRNNFRYLIMGRDFIMEKCLKNGII